ncbi:MAG: ABC transporter ATP-binding protein [Micromonosporaceae bacterium]|nr:ABC transporter ATP-binding protein [Micromonosporaceae bacterium]
MRPYRRQMTRMLLVSLAGTAAMIAVPLVVRGVVDGPVRRHQPGALLLLGVLAVIYGTLEAAFIFIRRWTQSETALGMETTLRRDLYEHLQRLPISFHERWQSGQLLSRATSDLAVLRRFLCFGLIFSIVNSLALAVGLGLLLRLDWPLGTLVAGSAVPIVFVNRRFCGQHLLIARRMQDQQGDLATFVEESARGIRVIKAFGRRQHMGRKFSEHANRLYQTAIGKNRLLATCSSQLDLIPNVTLGLVIAIGAVEVAEHRLSLGGLVAFVSLQTVLLWPIQSFGWIIATGQEAMTAADRVYEVLDITPSITDSPGAVVVHPRSVTGRIRFEQVGFAYPDHDGGRGRTVLTGVDLNIIPGETIAVVGATGCGKTALVSLVPRIYDVTAGRITIDDRDIRDYTLDSLRSIVGTAFEDPTLFSMSVRENLTLGHHDASESAIAEAIAVAQADFVYDLPWGLNTRIGEQGLSLSGGQRQRLALARAVLGRPRVLVLDDPLSALDVHTEARIEAALARILRETTALLVVHRPSTVVLADRVAWISDGTIRAVGTHSHLMATIPAYRAVLSASTREEVS